MLEVSYFKRIVIVPILCLFTLGFIMLFAHWYIALNQSLFYVKSQSLKRATHLMVFSTRKQKEIVKLNKSKKTNFVLELILKLHKTEFLRYLNFWMYKIRKYYSYIIIKIISIYWNIWTVLLQIYKLYTSNKLNC